ncbi:uncharacterized protein LOC142342952 [Convolutriloba macropyga]|uniref:uncharacterized protein LOC142342952 n=1 Tax=Convolutriloba macropyga TaxID=536237 RepID=UPI003F520C16
MDIPGQNQISLLHLPFDILEKICRFLLSSNREVDNSRKGVNIRQVFNQSGSYQSLMSLRSISRYLLHTVDHSYLEFCLDFENFVHYYTNLKFIANQTNWKISVLSIKLNGTTQKTPDVLKIFDWNKTMMQKLFQVKLFCVEMDILYYKLSYLRSVLDYLKASNRNIRVEVEMIIRPSQNMDLIEPVLLPEVQKLKIIYSGFSVLNDVILNLVAIMPNVAELQIEGYKMSLDNLALLSNWNRMTNLNIVPLNILLSHSEDIYFPNILHLRINQSYLMSDMSLIPKTFNNVTTIYFGKDRFQDRSARISISSFQLPKSCKTVGISYWFMDAIKHCNHLQTLYIEDFSWDSLRFLFEYEAELNALLLIFNSPKFDNSLRNISAILSRFASLEYLDICITNSRGTDSLFMVPGTPQYTKFINNISKVISSHDIKVLVIRSSFGGLVIFAKSNLRKFDLEKYWDICRIFEKNGNCFSISPVPIILDDTQYKNGIYIAARNVAYIKELRPASNFLSKLLPF